MVLGRAAEVCRAGKSGSELSWQEEVAGQRGLGHRGWALLGGRMWWDPRCDFLPNSSSSEASADPRPSG